MVVIAHFLILIGVSLIMLLIFGHGLEELPPTPFIVCEMAIIAMCFVAASITPGPWLSAVEKVLGNIAIIERFFDRHGVALGRRSQATVLLLAYFLQFTSLIPLLTSTGGPIDSPFAQMALAIAIFTPFIVNKPWTIVLVLAMTMVYYIAFVAAYGLDDEHIRPTPGSFVAVNLLILLLASILTFRYRGRRT